MALSPCSCTQGGGVNASTDTVSHRWRQSLSSEALTLKSVPLMALLEEVISSVGGGRWDLSLILTMTLAFPSQGHMWPSGWDSEPRAPALDLLWCCRASQCISPQTAARQGPVQPLPGWDCEQCGQFPPVTFPLPEDGRELVYVESWVLRVWFVTFFIPR